MKPAINHALHWDDKASIERMRSSDKGPLVQQAEIENILKDVAMRFERGPNPNTLSLWAKDLVAAGYSPDIVSQVAKSIPYKFVRHPSLAEITELLRPYLAQVSFSSDPLLDVCKRALPHLRAKFVRATSEEAISRMIKYYHKEVLNNESLFNAEHIEMCFLCDWLRTYFTDRPEKIIEQGKISSQSAFSGDIDYFINPLKKYVEHNGL